MTAPQDPRGTFRVSLTDSGLWVAESDRSEPHAHPLGLIVSASQPPPEALELPFRPLVRDGMLAYVTEEDVGLPTLGPAGVAAVMSRLPSELTFMNLALILRRLDRIRQDGPAHLALAREIYEDAPVMQELGRFAAVEGHVLFSEQGLLALMAQAIIHCRPDPNHEFTPEEWGWFKRVLLAAGGLLHDDAEMGEYEQDKPEEWLAFLTQNLLFNASANFGNGLARTWRMFGELAVDESATWTTPLDFPAVVAETGLTIAQQLAFAFALYATIGVDTDVIRITPDVWRSVCERVAADVPPDDLIAHMAATPDEMRAELTSDEARRFDPNLRWASVPFMERPFLRLDDGVLLLVSPRGIESWPVDGVHYRLLRAAKRLDRRRGIQHFTSFAGELTEAATIELVEDAYRRAAEQHVGVGRVIRSRPLKGGGESTDILMVEDGDIVLIEVSSSRITAKTRLTGDHDALRDDLAKVVVKRVEQLDRTVQAILNDEIPEIPAASVERIFAVIASMEPMHWSPPLHAYLVREVPDLLQQPVVMSLQFLEIEDLEALMSVLGPGSLAHLLDRKIQEAGPDTDVQQWFHDSPLAPRPKQTAMIEDRSDRLLDEMVTQLGFDRLELERLRNAPPDPTAREPGSTAGSS